MPAPAGASCTPAAGDPDDLCGQLAAAADAAVATVNAPATTRTMALDRLPGIFRCRDKGAFRWFAYYAICLTPDRNRRSERRASARGTWRGSGRRANSRLPSHGRGAVGYLPCRTAMGAVT